MDAVWNRRKQEWIEVDDDVAATPQKGASSPTNPFSSNAFKNSGSSRTDRPSTRSHAPPGGVTSISFGDYMGPNATPSAAAAPVAAKAAQESAAPATPTQPATPESAESVQDVSAAIPMRELRSAEEDEEEAEAKVKKGNETAGKVPPNSASAPAKPEPTTAPRSVSSNAYASGTNQNSGNVMTGRPTTRVRAPPGGASSITFG